MSHKWVFLRADVRPNGAAVTRWVCVRCAERRSKQVDPPTGDDACQPLADRAAETDADQRAEEGEREG